MTYIKFLRKFKYFNMMKTIYILSLLFLLSCGNEKAKADPANESTANASTSDAQQADNSNDLAPTNTVIKDPIKGGPADIEINVEGLANGTSLLIGFYAESHFRADSSTITNGKISFKNKEGYNQGIYYVSISNNEYIQIILGKDQEFEMDTKLGSVVQDMQVKGSRENELFYKNLKFESAFDKKYKPLVAKIKTFTEGTDSYKSANEEKLKFEEERKAHLKELFDGNEDLLFVSFKQAGQNPTIREGVSDAEKVYFYRTEFWDNVDFADTRLLRTPVVINKLKRYINELTPQNHDSIFRATKHLVDQTLEHPEYYKFITNWIALQYEPTKCSLMDPEYVYVNMVKNYFTKERAFWSDSMQIYALQNRAMEMSQSILGVKGPNVISTDPDGNKKALMDMTADYLVVYMYNPTCEHCMIQSPLLVEWYKEWKEKGADVYAIAVDTNKEEWTDYVKSKGMDIFTNVFDPSNRSIYAKYYVDITPEIYVLNKDRIIIGKNLKVNQIETIINQDKERQGKK